MGKYKKYITDDIINITKSMIDKSKSSLSNLSEAKEENLSGGTGWGIVRTTVDRGTFFLDKALVYP